MLTIYLKLFWSFFQVGLFSIGGGYAAMPLIQSQIVDINKFFTIHQFTDMITIAQMAPGSIAVNAATFVGNQVGGIGGAIVSTFGCVLPSFIIVLTLAFLYQKYRNITMVQGVLGGLRPAVVALIASAGLSILFVALWGTYSRLLSNVNFVAAALFAVSLFVLRRFKLSPIYVMIGSGVTGMVIYLLI